MPKRFTDTSIWQKPWFRKLGTTEKAAWFYILTSCDAVGVWDADLELAAFSIGKEVDWQGLCDSSHDNIRILEDGKWWIVDFCKYQYGVINAESESKVQRSLYSLLVRHGLFEAYETTLGPRVPRTLQEKEKEKVKDKDKEKDKDIYHAVEHAFLSKNGDRFTNYGKEGKAIHGLIDRARARMPDDPGAMLHAMLDAFWRMKAGDTSAKGFWRGQPFLPSALSPLWDRVLETMREDVVDPEILAIIKGGTP